MKKRKPRHTTRANIKAAIRLLWLRSPERAAILKEDGYRCQSCGKKQSKAKGKEVKVQVHHDNGILWDDICDLILFYVFHSKQSTMCEKCHKALTKIERGQ